MTPRPSSLDRKQLNSRLERIRSVASSLQPPRGGWIRALRNALGMRQRDLGQRLGITAQAIADLERREADGVVTLATLREAARALGGDVYYVVLPAVPLQQTLENRAARVARFMAGQVHHSMRMEDQGTGEEEQRATLDELRQTLLQTPSLLWKLPDDL